jgi:hypothetical protein
VRITKLSMASPIAPYSRQNEKAPAPQVSVFRDNKFSTPSMHFSRNNTGT